MLYFIVQHLSRISQHNQKHISQGDAAATCEFYLKSLLPFPFEANESSFIICSLIIGLNYSVIILLTLTLKGTKGNKDMWDCLNVLVTTDHFSPGLHQGMTHTGLVMERCVLQIEETKGRECPQRVSHVSICAQQEYWAGFWCV